MARSLKLCICTDPEMKADAELLFANLGITVEDAINMFLHQSLIMGGLPFELRLPCCKEQQYQSFDEFLKYKIKAVQADCIDKNDVCQKKYRPKWTVHL